MTPPSSRRLRPTACEGVPSRVLSEGRTASGGSACLLLRRRVYLISRNSIRGRDRLKVARHRHQSPSSPRRGAAALAQCSPRNGPPGPPSQSGESAARRPEFSFDRDRSRRVRVRGFFRDCRRRPRAAARRAGDFSAAAHDKGVFTERPVGRDVLARRGPAARTSSSPRHEQDPRPPPNPRCRQGSSVSMIPASHREYFLRRYFGRSASAFCRFWYKVISPIHSYSALKRRLRLRRLARALRSSELR